MVFFNTTNLTQADTPFDIVVAVNQSSGEIVGLLMVVGAVIVSLLVLTSRNQNFSASVVASLFLGTSVAFFLNLAGLLGTDWLIMLIVLLAGAGLINSIEGK